MEQNLFWFFGLLGQTREIVCSKHKKGNKKKAKPEDPPTGTPLSNVLS